MDLLLELTRDWPGAWKVLFFAMLPILELRGSIPYALFIEKMPWLQSYLFSVIGNAIPVIPILLFLEPAEAWLGRFPVFRRFFDWLFARTRRKGRLLERFKILGLVLFVAIPLPVTGAWTGSVAAYLFGVKRRVAFPAIFLGILIAGCVVTLVCKGVLGLSFLIRQI
ncbi:MAG: small multi-drug export protein [Candidatus Krumholzibacteria bacterium]|nr:small multi-drug export protein [Candidatus Krumholzibacteria bacterium]MDP7020885.1 small multi-drug export protein [Candidatus Krumholzibacteria bacterium]